MNFKIKNLLLIGSIVASVTLSSCSKDNDNSNPSDEITPPPSNETGTFTDNRDSTVYKWVKIGEQIWMVENLAYTGNDIQHITDNTEWKNNASYDAWCYYNNSDSLGQIYSVLYQWEAAKTACPYGWHLATYDDWATLIDYLGGESEAGGNMKEIGTNHWNSPNSGADNSSGFSALPGGNRNFNGEFNDLGDDGYWWTANQYDSNGAFYHSLNYFYSGIYTNGDIKFFGYSVRCVKD